MGKRKAIIKKSEANGLIFEAAQTTPFRPRTSANMIAPEAKPLKFAGQV